MENSGFKDFWIMGQLVNWIMVKTFIWTMGEIFNPIFKVGKEHHSFHADSTGQPVAATYSPLTAMGNEGFKVHQRTFNRAHSETQQ